MRGLLGLLARGAAGRGLPRGPTSPCGRHHQHFGPSFQPAPQSHPVPTSGGFDGLLRSWRPRWDAEGFSGLLGLLPARGAMACSWERKLVVVCGAARSAACGRELVGRGFRWMAFSLQKRQGFRVPDYYRRWNFCCHFYGYGAYGGAIVIIAEELVSGKGQRFGEWYFMPFYILSVERLQKVSNGATIPTLQHIFALVYGGLFLAYWRSWTPTSDGVVLGLIGINVAVFILWKIANPTFMMKNFTISLDNLKSGRLHTLVTSAFSHIDGDHCLINMLGFYFFGTSIAKLFGPKFLLKLYIAGAISGSIFYLLHKVVVGSSKGMNMVYHSREYALGASAAVNATMLLNIFLFPKSIIYLNFFIPVPAALVGAMIIGSDLLRIKRGDEHVSGSAHLGGALVAALVWARIKKRWM